MITKFIILQDLSLNGGTRQALKLYDSDDSFRAAIIKPKKFYNPRFIFNFFKLFYIYKGKFRFTFIDKPLTPSKNNIVISTSYLTLSYVSDISHSNHIHYFQHIELWDLYKSKYFQNYCVKNGYPDGKKIYEIIKLHKSSFFDEYLLRIGLIKNFYTVSNFLKDFLINVNKNQNLKINIMPVAPHIGENLPVIKKKMYTLFFLRGFPYKGDDMVYKLLKSNIFKHKYVVFSHYPKLSKIFFLLKNGINFSIKPSDCKLSKIFNKTNILVNSSYSEGFGSITIEANAYGAKIISSNTGWLVGRFKVNGYRIVKNHRKIDYVKAYKELLCSE